MSVNVTIGANCIGGSVAIVRRVPSAHELKERIEEARRDWETKEQDTTVPGAQPEPDEDEASIAGAESDPEETKEEPGDD